ncbi:MAG: hypothetical protein AB8H12_06190 [Lewinella sp.]
MFDNSTQDPNLDKISMLQRQSWQLELIITGFALAGMISGADAFHDFIVKWRDFLSNYGTMGTLGRGLLKGTHLAYFVVIFHFFLNVVVRCLWIGALTLRGVIGQEDYLAQRYHPIFDRFLRKRNGSFDAYINRLDTSASLIFAITFLMITVLFGVLSWTSVMAVVISSLVAAFGFPGAIAGTFISGIYVLFSSIYLIDFITGGIVKRGESRIYFPLYRIMGWLTFARLYRPLYYAIISNTWGKRLIWLVIPYVLLITIVPGRVLNFNSYINRVDYDMQTDQRYGIKDRYYEDKDGFKATKTSIFIPSDIITDKVLKVRLPLYESYYDILAFTCPLINKELITEQDTLVKQDTINATEANYIQSYKFGRSLGKSIRGGSGDELLPGEDSMMVRCLLDHLQLDLDGVPVNAENALIGTAVSGPPLPELIAYFPLRDIEPGMHRLHLSKRAKPNDPQSQEEVYVYRDYVIPFFYAPE